MVGPLIMWLLNTFKLNLLSFWPFLPGWFLDLDRFLISGFSSQTRLIVGSQVLTRPRCVGLPLFPLRSGRPLPFLVGGRKNNRPKLKVSPGREKRRFDMSKPRKKHTSQSVQVKISPVALDLLSLEIEKLEKMAETVALDAATTIKGVRELRKQFDSINVLVGDMI